MKKDQVRVGSQYTAKVSGGLATVKIVEEVWTGDKHTGWKAVNTQTGRTVRIKSAQRLRAVRGAAGDKGEGTATLAPAARHAGSSRPKGKNAPVKEPKSDRPMSGLDAAARVLAEAKMPMRVKDIVEAAQAKGYWVSKAGKTPAATVYAAIIREIRDKGGEARFEKKDRGLFTAVK